MRKAGLVTRDDRYQALLDAIALDIRQKRTLNSLIYCIDTKDTNILLEQIKEEFKEEMN